MQAVKSDALIFFDTFLQLISINLISIVSIVVESDCYFHVFEIWSDIYVLLSIFE